MKESYPQIVLVPIGFAANWFGGNVTVGVHLESLSSGTTTAKPRRSQTGCLTQIGFSSSRLPCFSDLSKALLLLLSVQVKSYRVSDKAS